MSAFRTVVSAFLLMTLAACASRAVVPVNAALKPMHHFVFFSQDRERMPGDSLFFSTPALEGAQVTYSWRQLEPQKDNYDFSLIREALALLSQRGKKLWIQIQDVTFDSARINIPRYLLNDPIYNGGAARTFNDRVKEEATFPAGWMARRWDPAVQERYHKLFEALGREFDGVIEGVNLDETSAGFLESGKHWPKGFSPEIYRDAIIKNMKALKRAFPKSVAMQYGNFMPGEWRPTEDKGYLRAVFAAAKQHDVGMGGPDLLPYRPGQLGNSYPLLNELSGVPKGISVQDGNFADINPKTRKPVTIEELVGFAANYLKVDYIFWGTEEPYYSGQVVPYLKGQKQKPD
jgi:hypothetical protein